MSLVIYKLPAGKKGVNSRRQFLTQLTLIMRRKFSHAQVLVCFNFLKNITDSLKIWWKDCLSDKQLGSRWDTELLGVSSGSKLFAIYFKLRLAGYGLSRLLILKVLQTMQILNRGLYKKSSDLGVHCFQRRYKYVCRTERFMGFSSPPVRGLVYFNIE